MIRALPLATLLAVLAFASAGQGLLPLVAETAAPAGRIVSEAPGLATSQTGTLTVYNCGGTSPVTTTCARSVTAGPGMFWLQTDAGTGFTGTVVATLWDADGHYRSLACTYFVFVGPVTQPSCTSGGNGDLHAPSLTLVGSATQASGTPPVGYWEVRVAV